MINPTILNELTDKLSSLIPPDVKIIKKDLEKSIHAILQSTFQKLDLVSREEFDVQAAVLAKTRQKLEALEQKIQELESKQSKKK